MRRGRGQVDDVFGNDPTGPVAHQHHPVGQPEPPPAHCGVTNSTVKTCFGDDAFEFGVQQVAGDRVERAKMARPSTVHRHLGPARARECYALTHPAGTVDAVERQRRRPVPRRRAARPTRGAPPQPWESLRAPQRQVDVAGRGQPREKRADSWNIKGPAADFQWIPYLSWADPNRAAQRQQSTFAAA